jgi:predicted rRNA methylase YqxC with S4 and FtsJ domains
MKELTAKQIAEKAGIDSFETVKSRIRILGIKPAFKVGRSNVYAPGVVERIKNFDRTVGRPPKAKKK